MNAALIAALSDSLPKVGEPEVQYTVVALADLRAAIAALAAAPEQAEPVALATCCDDVLHSLSKTEESANLRAESLREQNRGRDFRIEARGLVFAHSAAQAAQPLTDEQIAAEAFSDFAVASPLERSAFRRGARFAERAHGIGAQEQPR